MKNLTGKRCAAADPALASLTDTIAAAMLSRRMAIRRDGSRESGVERDQDDDDSDDGWG